MSSEKRAARERDRPDINPPEVVDIAPVEPDEPAVPKGMSDDEAEGVRSQAAELVEMLGDATGGKEMELLDRVTNVGLQVQRNAARQLDLLKTRTGTFLSEGGTSKDIADGLRNLRLTLNEINPQQMTHPGIANRVFGMLPLLRGRFNPVTRALNRIALRYEPVSRQVAVIETKLRDGRALLVRDNVELRTLYEDVETQQLPIQRNAYLGELLMRRLSELQEQTDDPVKRDRVQDTLHDVAMRVQNLRTMEEVHVQYFVSIEMSWQNNNRLGQSVESTLTLATNVVTVGLAIQSALIRQKRVMEAARRTREFLGDLVAANAVAIRRHTQEIGDLYNSPVIALEKITQAHDDLVEPAGHGQPAQKRGHRSRSEQHRPAQPDVGWSGEEGQWATRSGRQPSWLSRSIAAKEVYRDRS